MDYHGGFEHAPRPDGPRHVNRAAPDKAEGTFSPWPHRLAWALACTTFLLIAAGSTVTSYQAGMAVEDWPTTRGHWFYPVQLWLTEGWDLFLEQSHRMLGQLAGALTIATAVLLWVTDRRSWMRLLGVAAVLGIVLQETLGGLRVIGADVVAWLEDANAPGMPLLRVIGDDVLLKRLHASTAPLFFALCAALVTLTSRAWREPRAAKSCPAARRLRRAAVLETAGVFLLIVLGTLLRHSYLYAPERGFDVWGWLKTISGGLIWTRFQLWLALKLILAGLVGAGLAWLFLDVRRTARDRRMIARRVNLLAVLFLLQLFLGAAAWVTNYNVPAWFTDYVWAVEYTVVEEGRLQAITTTLHSAFGSLVLVASLSLTLWLFRLLRPS